jgi:DNA invertase Pin-like site-specific DNA recombinase
MIAFLSALAEDERQRILERCKGGMKAAKAKGIRLGRKPKLSEHLGRKPGESARTIGKSFGVPRAATLRAPTRENARSIDLAWLRRRGVLEPGRQFRIHDCLELSPNH